MDGIHDLGGKQGYGPVEVDENDVPFHHEWEGREWGISRSARVPGINIDWWRHCRELIMPEDYLGRPYFDSWAQTDFATYLNAGVLSMEEVISGKAIPGRPDNDEQAPVLTMEQAIQADRNSAARFDAEIEASPLFSIGQEVITSKHGHTTSSRTCPARVKKPGSICIRLCSREASYGPETRAGITKYTSTFGKATWRRSSVE